MEQIEQADGQNFKVIQGTGINNRIFRWDVGIGRGTEGRSRVANGSLYWRSFGVRGTVTRQGMTELAPKGQMAYGGYTRWRKEAGG